MTEPQKLIKLGGKNEIKRVNKLGIYWSMPSKVHKVLRV